MKIGNMKSFMEHHDLFAVMMVALLLSGCSEQTTLHEVAGFPFATEVNSEIYPSLDGIYAKLSHMKDDYPQLIKLYSLGQSAIGKREIPLAVIGRPTNESGKNYLFVGGTHGDEAVGVEALLFTMEELLSDIRSENDTALPEGVSLYFVPVFNPDGYQANARENGHQVDLNRNFPFGKSKKMAETETQALLDLINQTDFRASIFFHSANESKYENVVRVPIEFGAGKYGLGLDDKSSLWRLAHLVADAGNTTGPGVDWSLTQDMVNAEGIASDWVSSGLGDKGLEKYIQKPCRYPHPSVTVELCYPKQPMNHEKVMTEKKEVREIVRQVVNQY